MILFLFVFLMTANEVRWTLNIALICISRSPSVWPFPCPYEWNLFFSVSVHSTFLGFPLLHEHPWPWPRAAPERPWCFLPGGEFCPGFWPPHSPAHCTERQRCCWDGPSAGHTASSPRQTFGVPWSAHTAPSGYTWEGHNDHQLTQKGMGISRSSWALSNPKGLVAPPSPSFYYALPSSTMLSFEKGSCSPTPFTGEKSHTWVTPSWPAYFLSIHSLWHPSPSPFYFLADLTSPPYMCIAHETYFIAFVHPVLSGFPCLFTYPVLFRSTD